MHLGNNVHFVPAQQSLIERCNRIMREACDEYTWCRFCGMWPTTATHMLSKEITYALW